MSSGPSGIDSIGGKIMTVSGESRSIPISQVRVVSLIDSRSNEVTGGETLADAKQQAQSYQY